MHQQGLLSLYLLLLSACSVTSTESESEVTRHVTAFYYLWYGTPELDDRYLHWDHSVLPHWDENVRNKFQSGQKHNPPEDIHSPYYPARGVYSVRDENVIRAQLKEIEDAGIDSVSLSWWGRSGGDTQGVNTDEALSNFIAIVENSSTSVKVAFHLEPYPGRNIISIHEDIEYLNGKYSKSTATFKDAEERMLFFVYDSYHLPPRDWQRLFCEAGDLYVKKKYPGLFVGLWHGRDGGRQLADGCFDGGYTYFSSQRFSYGSTVENWATMSTYMEQNKMLFIPSVGPGYNDTRIRPWNNHNTKPRGKGKYYNQMWKAAVASSNGYISITSYNEWGEGTQIEPAQENRLGYVDYSPNPPGYYLHLTQEWIHSWSASTTAGSKCGENLDGNDNVCT